MVQDWIAHINHDDKRTQTLEEHCIETAELASGFLCVLGLSSFGYLAGLLHDMGKACTKFLKHIEEKNTEKIDHATVAAQYLYQLLPTLTSVYEMYAVHILIMVIMSHHTGLENYLSVDGSSTYLRRLQKQIDTYDEATQNYLKDVCDESNIRSYIAECGKSFQKFYEILDTRYKNVSNNIDMQFFECSLLGRLIFSSLIDADRKNSFEFDKNIEQKDADTKPWNTYYDQLMSYYAGFDKHTAINDIRTEIAKICDEAGKRPQGIYELSVPTGGGKTLSSLRFALRHAMTHSHIQHIIYVVPYNTILNQNADSIRQILFGDGPCTEDEFLLHNSTVIASDEDRYLKYTERWNSNIIMTSYVQLLNTLFLGRKQDARRMHQLANAILIFDEIQCLPLKVMNMFNTAMNFLHHVGNSTILLCTATQPKLHEISKPILMSPNASLIQKYASYYEKLKRVELVNLYRDGGYSMDDFIENVDPLVRNVDSALIVMNTKKQATMVYEELQKRFGDACFVYYVTTSMCHAHREDILKVVMEHLNKKEPVKLVSTNLIEAGVDISFPVVIRALAGMDNIVQCAGRCNRNQEMELGKVYVLNMNNDPLRSLPELQIKKRCTELLLHQYSENPKDYDSDLLSLKAMNAYYTIYNNELSTYYKDWINYNDKNIQGTLYDLLSSNKYGKTAGIESHVQVNQLPFLFAYEEAGKRFCVIDQATEDVIVPYGEGEEIIASLLSNTLTNQELRSLLKKAQRYTVSLYKSQLKDLGDRIVQIEPYGIKILAKSHYDDKKGVVLDGQCLGFIE